MKFPTVVLAVLTAVGALAATYHRSFRSGYPSESGVRATVPANSAVLKAPKTVRQKKGVVITNRVVLTKEQAEKLLKAKERQKKSK